MPDANAPQWYGGRAGILRAGEYAGRYVTVELDESRTGWHIWLTADPALHHSTTHNRDIWADNEAQVEEWFSEELRSVEWLTDAPQDDDRMPLLSEFTRLWHALVERLIELSREHNGRVRLDVSEAERTVTCRPAVAASGTTSITVRVDHAAQITIDVGRGTHYDVYASKPGSRFVLVAEAVECARSVIAGQVQEDVWTRDGQLSATRLTYLDRGVKVSYSNGLWRRRRGSPTKYRYSSYPPSPSPAGE